MVKKSSEDIDKIAHVTSVVQPPFYEATQLILCVNKINDRIFLGELLQNYGLRNNATEKKYFFKEILTINTILCLLML